MPEYRITCSGEGHSSDRAWCHAERLLGVLIDNRQSDWTQEEATKSFERLQELGAQLDPNWIASDHLPLEEVVRLDGLRATKIAYRQERVRTTAKGDEWVTQSSGSLVVRDVRRGREFVFTCRSCRANNQRHTYQMSEVQVEALVDLLASKAALSYELSSKFAHGTSTM